MAGTTAPFHANRIRSEVVHETACFACTDCKNDVLIQANETRDRIYLHVKGKGGKWVTLAELADGLGALITR